MAGSDRTSNNVKGCLLIVAIMALGLGIGALMSAKKDRAIADVNSDVEGGNASWQEGVSILNSIITDIDGIGLEKVREQRKDASKKADDAFDKAIACFTTAAGKCAGSSQDYSDSPGSRDARNYYLEKGRAYARIADVNKINRQMIDAIFDTSLNKATLLDNLKYFATLRSSAMSSVGGDNFKKPDSK